LFKDQPKLAPATLLAAFSHETRVHAISVLTDQTASPAQIAKELDRSVRHVTYHFEKLEELGIIEHVRTEPAAGGRTVQKLYHATQRVWFDRDAWKQMRGRGPTPQLTAAIMGLINRDIAIAMASGTFDGEDNHISRTPMLLDAEGYQELLAMLEDVLQKIFAIKERTAARITKDSKTVLTIANILQFDLPESAWSILEDDLG
jgi:Helix-turn-helix domain